MVKITPKIERLLDDLQYDLTRYELEDFIKHVITYRSRMIMVYPTPLQNDLSGAWVRAPRRDYIVVNARLHPIHQRHTILHEIGHILLGHKLLSITDLLAPELLAQLGDNLRLGRIQATLSELQDDDEEQEAEAFATFVQRKVLLQNRRAMLFGNGSSIPVLREYIEGMAYH